MPLPRASVEQLTEVMETVRGGEELAIFPGQLPSATAPHFPFLRQMIDIKGKEKVETAIEELEHV